MKKHFVIMALATLLVAFAACNRNGKKTENPEDKPENVVVPTEIDEVPPVDENIVPVKNNVDMLEQYKLGSSRLAPDVVSFMDSIGKSPDDLVTKALKELGNFQKKKRKFYPDAEVKGALDKLATMLNSSTNDTKRYNELMAYWFNFANQAALLCPKLEYIGKIYTPDCKVGLLSYGLSKDGYQPLMSYLLVQDGNRCKLQLIDPSVALLKIFNLKEAGKEYYLFTSSFDKKGDQLDVYLYEKGVNGLDFIAKMNEKDPYTTMLNGQAQDNTKIVYSPEKHQWDLCVQKGKYWNKIDGSKSLYLHLDGEKPYFEMH